MNRDQRKKVRNLERRAEWLELRIAEREERGEAHSGDFDRAELAALRWALGIILGADEEGILDELDLRWSLRAA